MVPRGILITDVFPDCFLRVMLKCTLRLPLRTTVEHGYKELVRAKEKVPYIRARLLEVVFATSVYPFVSRTFLVHFSYISPRSFLVLVQCAFVRLVRIFTECTPFWTKHICRDKPFITSSL
jgi:hypothetical protein